MTALTFHSGKHRQLTGHRPAAGRRAAKKHRTPAERHGRAIGSLMTSERFADRTAAKLPMLHPISSAVAAAIERQVT